MAGVLVANFVDGDIKALRSLRDLQLASRLIVDRRLLFIAVTQ